MLVEIMPKCTFGQQLIDTDKFLILKKTFSASDTLTFITIQFFQCFMSYLNVCTYACGANVLACGQAVMDVNYSFVPSLRGNQYQSAIKQLVQEPGNPWQRMSPSSMSRAMELICSTGLLTPVYRVLISSV